MGSAVFIALGVGCSRESRPAQAPPTGTTSPTFESNVPTPPAPPPGHEQPAPAPHPEMGAPAPLPPPGAAPPPPPSGELSAPAPGTPSEPPATAAAESERQVCDSLASVAILRVEDVKNGAAIVIVPKRGHDLASVRDDARRVETTMRQSAGAPSAPTPSSGATCGLFSVMQLPGVTATLTEGAKSVRIVLTTPNPAEVKDLRRTTREQVHGLGVKAR